MSRRFVAREGSCWTLSYVLHVLLRLLLCCGVVRRISIGRSLVSCLVLRFSRLKWRQQFGLLVRAQPAWWSCGCGSSEVSAYGAYESSAVLSSMAVSARFSEASLCLSGFSLSQGQSGRVSRGASIFPCLLSRLCLISPTRRSGSALRRPGRVLLLGLGRRFRASIWSVEALPARRPRHGDLVLDDASPQPAFLGACLGYASSSLYLSGLCLTINGELKLEETV
ncbi:hypothetical protein F2Q69_00030609 [Brassica cretica]|uniref:Uncharacterized protein n=1 Tax=Brassica cretica TaxID=69181 RepID=A0A8S9RRN9_BRACR|nr:hypothetical protein F2Q69_00030609 [Brassica cretica]